VLKHFFLDNSKIPSVVLILYNRCSGLSIVCTCLIYQDAEIDGKSSLCRTRKGTNTNRNIEKQCLDKSVHAISPVYSN
jgi:hypothetical protein